MKRVLVVDDSKTQQLFLGRLLEEHGFEKLTAMDGETGIALARSEQPDLILMDVVMPKMNGFQATRQISLDPQIAAIPVVILSGKDMECDRVWGLRQGAQHYLTKPVEKAALMVCIESVLGAANRVDDLSLAPQQPVAPVVPKPVLYTSIGRHFMDRLRRINLGWGNLGRHGQSSLTN
ncbi:MAG: response regulator [Gammaproteobacteria bacterium]|nr:response regulator [Gammaproteobacteria bacterium]